MDINDVVFTTIYDVIRYLIEHAHWPIDAHKNAALATVAAAEATDTTQPDQAEQEHDHGSE